MDVEVNGEEREFADGTTLAQLLEQLGTAQRGVAVAVDGTVVTRSEWQDVVLTDGAKVEILTAVQGG
ncbi:sulfur carrier protein ThiS [Haloechinothrix halophila]|uniref:sulfur carrier protein ThiS n=1 Tax=Haloechinothrix halophila TaxID=1069073 RepID=UPI000411CCD7|nr:sulfur carrier protein ThiS [Haloechinothrix halophila]